MRAVLYSDQDMEPITVFDIPQWAMERLKDREQIRFAVHRPVKFHVPTVADTPESFDSWTVTVWAEHFMRKGQAHIFIFTRQDELAMKLKAEFLPGQHKEVQDREKHAFIEGLLAALRT